MRRDDRVLRSESRSSATCSHEIGLDVFAARSATNGHAVRRLATAAGCRRPIPSRNGERMGAVEGTASPGLPPRAALYVDLDGDRLLHARGPTVSSALLLGWPAFEGVFTPPAVQRHGRTPWPWTSRTASHKGSAEQLQRFHRFTWVFIEQGRPHARAAQGVSQRRAGTATYFSGTASLSSYQAGAIPARIEIRADRSDALCSDSSRLPRYPRGTP